MMAKFRNKKTKKVVEENLLYYMNKYRNNPKYEEIIDKKQEQPKSKNKEKEVENVEPLQ